jgi:hypothetical protein
MYYDTDKESAMSRTKNWYLLCFMYKETKAGERCASNNEMCLYCLCLPTVMSLVLWKGQEGLQMACLVG